MLKVAIVVVSSSDSTGEEASSSAVKEKIKEFEGEEVYYNVIPGEFQRIQEELFNITERSRADLVFTIGGTGFSHEDITPEATMAVIEKETPGLTEFLRWKRFRDNPEVALSRSRAGIRKSTLIINLPANVIAIRESLEALIPLIPRGIRELQDDSREFRLKMRLWE